MAISPVSCTLPSGRVPRLCAPGATADLFSSALIGLHLPECLRPLCDCDPSQTFQPCSLSAHLFVVVFETIVAAQAVTLLDKASSGTRRLHQQVRRLERVFGKGDVIGKVVDNLGQTTTFAAKHAEHSRILAHFRSTGLIPLGDLKSFRL